LESAHAIQIPGGRGERRGTRNQKVAYRAVPVLPPSAVRVPGVRKIPSFEQPAQTAILVREPLQKKDFAAPTQIVGNAPDPVLISRP